MLNVLITAIGGDVGQGILKSLRLSSKKVNVIGTDITARASGLFMSNKGFIVTPAKKNEKRFIEELIRICKEESIDIVYCAHEDEQLAIANNIELLNEQTKAYFVVQSKDVLLITRDKYRIYKYLNQKGFCVPETQISLGKAQELISKHGYPIIIKPRYGSGSRDMYIVKNSCDLKKYWNLVSDPIAQQYISNRNGDEYTVGIFLDKHSKAKGAIAMLRQLECGLTSHAIVDDYPEMVDLAIKVAESINVVGPCNVQLRSNQNNKPCVIEINARISSSAIFRAKLGFNEVQASIDYFLEGKSPKLTYKKSVVMRTWDELIVSREQYEKLKETKEIINRKW